MKLRTRLAIMIVLILIGCVFAAPFYRTSNSHTALTLRSNASSPPTLQIRRTPPQPPMEVVDAQPANPGLPSSNSHNWSSNRFSDLSVAEIPPIAAIDLPPPLEVSHTALKPVGVRGNRVGQQRLKPVSLIGINIGSDVTRTLNRKSTAPIRAISSNMRSTRRGEKLQEASNHEAQKKGARIVQPQRWHRIVNGDTLKSLAQQYYGSPEHALSIFEANRNTLVSPTILPISTELFIPHLAPARERQSPPARQPAMAFSSQETRPGWHRVHQKGIDNINGL